MGLPRIAIENEIFDNADKESDKYLKEKRESIEESLKFDYPVVFTSDNAFKDGVSHMDCAAGENLKKKTVEHVVLSWENVNVFKKNEFKLKNIFKRRMRDSNYLLHKDELSNLNQKSSIQTISFTKNAVENESLESLSSSSSSSSSSNSIKPHRSNQILFNGLDYFRIKKICSKSQIYLISSVTKLL